jgi:hypothetical protein
MTLYSSPTPGGSADHRRVSYTNGPVEIHIDEHIGHLRSFWGQLGRDLDEAEKALKPPDAEEVKE